MTDKTNINCCRHAGFVESPTSSEDVNDDDVPLSDLLRQFKERKKDEVSKETYHGIDQNLVTSPDLTEAVRSRRNIFNETLTEECNIKIIISALDVVEEGSPISSIRHEAIPS